MEGCTDKTKYSLDELYGELYKCVSCGKKQKENQWFERNVCDIYRNCGIDFCEPNCKCYVCIKCFGCPGCALFDPFDFDFPENQNQMEEYEDKLLNSVHQSTRTDEISFKKVYRKKNDKVVDENEFVIQRPFNDKFKQLTRNTHLMYRKRLYYVKTVKQAKSRKRDKRISLNIRKVDFEY